MKARRSVLVEVSSNWVRMLLCAVFVAVFALAFGAQGVSAQTPGVDYETGNYCIQDYQPGAVCTANDVRIKSITPSMSDLCVGAGDSVTANFKAEILTGATERYDIGMFVGLDGNSAQSGDNCYHDFLQEPSLAGPWDLLSGLGPFKSLETKATEIDACADTLQNDGNVFYNFQAAVTVACIDLNQDGYADPFSTCTSWDNNSNSLCNDVKNAFPGTNSKCWCGPVEANPPIFFYSGADYGDLPDSYGTYTTTNPLTSGAAHAVQDLTSNHTPDTISTTAAIWLGSTVDYSTWAESNGIPTTGADGDDINTGDDENGVDKANTWEPMGTGQINVTVNSTDGECIGCRLGFWLDWNNDGDFADPGESYVQSVNYGTQTLNFSIPVASWAVWPAQVYGRFRLYDAKYTGTPSPLGLVANGEVEDYRFDAPTGVDITSFKAMGANKSVALTWETVSEVDTLGFNVYRGTSANGAKMKVNSALIASAVAPGSPFGADYEYADSTVKGGKTYYYWLETVDIFGRTAMQGPVAARVK